MQDMAYISKNVALGSEQIMETSVQHIFFIYSIASRRFNYYGKCSINFLFFAYLVLLLSFNYLNFQGLILF